ncbi:hypothetical protein LXA43DRAFT_1020496, partial [Ganoderma leucocontextum]
MSPCPRQPFSVHPLTFLPIVVAHHCTGRFLLLSLFSVARTARHVAWLTHHHVCSFHSRVCRPRPSLTASTPAPSMHQVSATPSMV